MEDNIRAVSDEELLQALGFYSSNLLNGTNRENYINELKNTFYSCDLNNNGTIERKGEF